MNYGFIKACAVSPALRVADCPYNAQETIEAMQQAAEDGCQLTVFPELGLTGYTCGDLFLQQPLLDAAEAALRARFWGWCRSRTFRTTVNSTKSGTTAPRQPE